MPQTESLIWIILACTGTICVIALIGVFANIMSYETRLHALRNRVAELQYTYALRLARLHGHIGDEEGEVDIIEDEQPVATAGKVRPGGFGDVEILEDASEPAAAA